MKKRLLAGLLALCLALTLCPAALADEDELSPPDASAQPATEEDAGGTPGAAEVLEAIAALKADALAPSEKIAEFIKLYESFSAQPYNDGGKWYIGYGVACDPVDWPDGITEEEASQQLRDRLDTFAADVRGFLDKYDVSVTQSQFDALVSMTYNFGPSWLNVSNRLPLYLTQGIEKYSEWEIVNAFGTWCHIGKVLNEALLSRRIAEAMVFLKGDYSRDVSDWCRLDIDAAGGSVNTDVWCYRTGQSYGTLPATTRSGFTFRGWRRDDGTMLTESDIASGTIHITAVWNAPNIFSDVKTGDWFYDAVMELTGKKVISGFNDGTFRPQASVTKGQALKLVLLAAGYSEKSAAPGQHWAAGYRSYAVGRGLVREGDYADLDAVISRNEIADLAAAALRLDTSAYTENPFADSSRPSVLALYGEGIVEGSFDDKGQRFFSGLVSITRAEMSAVVQRLSVYAGHHPLPAEPDPEPAPEPAPAPANPDPLRNSYDTSKFRTKLRTEYRTVKNEDGKEVEEEVVVIDRIYYDDPAYDVRYGIDVSAHQGAINWQAVAADGIDFAMLRIGYRGYGSLGSLNRDSYFLQNARGATAAGLDIGVYFYSQAITVGEARLEAEYLLDLLSEYNGKVTFPIAFDWETNNSNNSRTHQSIYDYSILPDCARAFCSVIEAAGYKTMVYTFPADYNRGYNTDILREYDLWLAHHTARNGVAYSYFPYNFQIWQYTDKGSVNGISTNVDMNIAFVDYAKK